MYPRLGVAFAAMAVAGCAITQEVTPFKLGQPAQDLCLVRNSEVVQDAFHDVYVTVLERKGFRVRSLPDKSPVDTCPLLATYEAIYRWDMAIYLARADLRVFAEGNEAGRAVYDSLSGGANMNKFIRTEPKLTELVDQLFSAPVKRQAGLKNWGTTALPTYPSSTNATLR